MKHLSKSREGKLTPWQRDEIAAKYESGASLASLAKLFGIRHKNVRNIILARGVPIRPYVTPLPKEKAP